MAGGKGTRLWPVSRQSKPKQFQSLVSDKTMLQETFLRLRKKFPLENVYISTNAEYVSEVEKEILELPQKNIISEPEARGTASSFALTTAVLTAEKDDVIIATFPADHLVKKPKVLINALEQAEKFIMQNPNHIVTIGVKPTYPETGYGYIKSNQDMQSVTKDIELVERFVEKPDAMTAQTYVDAGNFYWNTGIYIFRAKALEENFKKYLPDTHKRLVKIRALIQNNAPQSAIEKEYAKMDKTTIEYSVVENTSDVAVAPIKMGWSDIGSWTSLKDTLIEKNTENFVKGEHVDFDSENILVYGSKKLITTIGLKDLIIVDTDDAILICDRNRSQEISSVVKKLEKSNYRKNLI